MTDQNENSSRKHTIFKIKPVGIDNSVYAIDLAGTESIYSKLIHWINNNKRYTIPNEIQSYLNGTTKKVGNKYVLRDDLLPQTIFESNLYSFRSVINKNVLTRDSGNKDLKKFMYTSMAINTSLRRYVSPMMMNGIKPEDKRSQLDANGIFLECSVSALHFTNFLYYKFFIKGNEAKKIAFLCLNSYDEAASQETLNLVKVIP